MLTKLTAARIRTSLDITCVCRIAIFAIFVAGCGAACGAATRAAVQATAPAAVMPSGAAKLDDCADACDAAYASCVANTGKPLQCAAQRSNCYAGCP